MHSSPLRNVNQLFNDTQAIHGYRETEISVWKDPNNTSTIQRLRNQIFANGSTEPMQRVHILDLCDIGYVKPHVDSIRVSMSCFLWFKME